MEQFKEVKVRRYLNGRVNRYHIIRASIPPHWSSNPEVHIQYHLLQLSYFSLPLRITVFTNAGYSTTLGFASFREPKHNKIDVPTARTKLRPGRPKKVSTTCTHFIHFLYVQ